MRGDQLSRQWRILRQIEASKSGRTAAEIADLVGVSLRTAYRDLDDLQLAGFPLYAEKRKNSNLWKFVDTYRFKVPPPFTFTELMSLHLGRDLFRVLKGTVFAESLESIFKKVRSTLPPPTLEYLDRIQSTFHMGIKPYKDYKRFREIINRVNQAAMECRCIEMIYKPLRRKKETLRTIDPYKIWFYEGTIYIIGFCHLRQEIRTFVVDRIKLLRLTDEKFKRPQDLDIDEYTRHSFRVMQDELYTVKVRIAPAWAKYVGEKIWHESQIACKMPDKSLELSFRVAGLEEMKQWVMGLGPEAYVIEPERLKEMVKAGLRKALIQYEGLRLAKRRSDTQGDRSHLA
ncbi:MAG: transcriptional regulator [Deltaproteobacteria bacterium]|nr:transcriptional regulator [Deltaproteobacteria bacterium]MBW2202194.1 transcriptional regulator [Deltaproteobacteria bacterium]